METRLHSSKVSKNRVCNKQAKGWLVYFKSSLTGDEPEDVEQYHATTWRFPSPIHAKSILYRVAV